MTDDRIPGAPDDLYHAQRVAEAYDFRVVVGGDGVVVLDDSLSHGSGLRITGTLAEVMIEFIDPEGHRE